MLIPRMAHRYTEEAPVTETESAAPPSSFNPSADAAPVVPTPKKSTAAPSDCSYSKLISKIRENQAKCSAVLPSTSRSQSPALDAGDLNAPLTADVDNKHPSPLVTSTVLVTPTAAPAPAPPTAAPVTSTPTSAPVKPTPPKTFTGLVDYPSFNNTNNDLSTTDSDSDTTFTTSSMLNGLKNGKTLTSKSKISTKKQSPEEKRLLSKKVKSVLSSLDKASDYSAISWPSRNQQIVIDKIACNVVINGTQFEQSLAAVGK